jgi:hypothetical protein
MALSFHKFDVVSWILNNVQNGKMSAVQTLGLILRKAVNGTKQSRQSCRKIIIQMMVVGLYAHIAVVWGKQSKRSNAL